MFDVSFTNEQDAERCIDLGIRDLVSCSIIPCTWLGGTLALRGTIEKGEEMEKLKR